MTLKKGSPVLIRCLPSLLPLGLLLAVGGCTDAESQPDSAAGTSSAAGGGSGAASGGSSSGSVGTSGSGGMPMGGGGASTAGSSGAGGGGAAAIAGGAGMGGGGPVDLPPFSFFVASIEAMRMLSGNEKGFGGDLRFGKADGLSGADEICRQTAEMGMEGAGQKQWRAFLSTTAGPVHAIDRIGEGPWYDRLGRLVAMNKADLANPRPVGAHEIIIDDLPNEHGIPNGHPIPGGERVDNHHTLTGSDEEGRLNGTDMGDTCNDWTSKEGALGKPRCGVSWPRNDGDSWISFLDEGGCAPGFNLIEGAGPPQGDEQAVGANGGYGGIYCFSLTP
jgi:hypothetical protein